MPASGRNQSGSLDTHLTLRKNPRRNYRVSGLFQEITAYETSILLVLFDGRFGCVKLFCADRKGFKRIQTAMKQVMVPAPLRSASAPAIPAHPSPYNFAGVQYPRIEADSRVTFHFKAPDAQKVQVSIDNVPFDMVKGDDGVWTYTSEPQAPGYHNYWMIVDGAIVLDPAHQRVHRLRPHVQWL